ncbi:MAG TPA: hypothetical protein PKV72_01405 [Candidatus Peribacteria bacterium]|nr:hypothetical protein [Candidatus Peribacteria bacterium]
MPNETEAAATETADTGAEAIAAEPKGPPKPATPPAITDAVLGFEAAMRAWWTVQSPDNAAAVGGAITRMMVAKGETAFEPTIALRMHFSRFRSANPDVVRTATTAAIGILIPATLGSGPVPHLPVVTKPDPGSGAD